MTIKRLIRYVADDLVSEGYAPHRNLYYKRSASILIAVCFRVTSNRDVQIALCVLPCDFVKSGLPKDEGGFGLRCYADLLPDFADAHYFRSLEEIAGGPVLKQEFVRAFGELLAWCETHLADEQLLRKMISTPDSWVKNIGFCSGAMHEWADGKLNVESYPEFMF